MKKRPSRQKVLSGSVPSNTTPAEPLRPASIPWPVPGPSRFLTAEFTFHSAALIWLITCATLWVLGHVLARFAPAPMPDMNSLRAQFMPWVLGELAPEPQERRLYMSLTLLAPLVIFAGWATVRRVTAGRAGATFASERVHLSDWTVAGASLFLCFGGVSFYLALTAPIVKDVFRPVVTDSTLPALGAALVLWWVLGCKFGRHWRRAVWGWWRGVTLSGALVLALGAGIVLRVYDYASAPLAISVHLNTALYPIAQASNGQHILVDFLPQYGCYAEFLKPWFGLIGFSVLRMTATLAFLQGLAIFAVVFTLAQLLRSRVLLCLAAAAFAWLMHVWFNFGTVPLHVPLALGAGSDPYFQYYPIRLLFPALSLPTAWWYLRCPSRARAAMAGALGGFAVWWNVDTGAVVLASIVVLLAVKACSEWRGRPSGERKRAGQYLLAAASAAVLALVGFYLVLCLDARQVVNLAGVLRYQQIFYISGFAMLPMPLDLNCWHLVVGVYLLGLTHGLKGVLTGRPLAVHSGFVLYLSVLGLGLFSYYQGRSHDNVLMLCDWPAVALAVLLCDRLLAATRYGLLPRLYSAVTFPMLALGTACVCCLWLSHPSIIATEMGSWQAHVQHKATPQTDAVGYLKRSVPHGESSVVISPFQAIYAAATGLRSGLTGPSIYEYLLQSDAKSLSAQLSARRVQHLFTEPVFYPETYGLLGPSFGDAMHKAYRVVGSNPAGNLLQWEPRPDATLGAFPGEFAAQTRLSISPPTLHHAVRLAGPNVLLDAEEMCVGAFPYSWGAVAFGSNFAFEMILTPAADQPDYACLISNHPGGGGDGLAVQRIGGTKTFGAFVCYFGDGHRFATSVPFALSSGVEHYFAASSDANHVSIYIDGQLNQELQLDGPVPPSATALTIGDWFSGDRRFAGEIAEVKIHDHALSAEIVAGTWKQITAGSNHRGVEPTGK